jgi:hypothetical protein
MAKFTDGNILDKLDDLEAPSIVKIYTKIIRRKYKRRFLYAYSKYLVPVSARYIGAIKSHMSSRKKLLLQLTLRMGCNNYRIQTRI